MPKTVLLVQHDADSLTERERREIYSAFGKDVVLVRTDPKNAEEHLADCNRLNADAVILPPKPFWEDAEDAGYRHGAMMQGRQGLVLRRVSEQRFTFAGYGNIGFKPWPDLTPFAYYR
jgi:hypothetical protein